MNLMRKLTWCSAKYNFVIHAKFIPEVENTTADALSRFQMRKFRALVPTAHQFPVDILPPSELMTI